MEAGEAEIEELNNALKIVKNILMIAGLVLLFATLNIIQITTANLYDIRKELGIRMALGATRIKIMKEIAFDVFFSTIQGGYIGVTLYAILVLVVNRYIRDYGALEEIMTPILGQYAEYFRLTFNVVTVLIGITLSAVVGIVSAVIPALKSISIDPIAVLRKE